jgi:uncharacterized protein (DUF362 family)
MKSSKVFGHSCGCYSYEEVYSAIETNFKRLGGLDSIVKKGEKVLIKPNIVAPISKQKAANTHPIVVEVLVDMLNEIDAIPVVGESSGFIEIGDTSKNMAIAGYTSKKLTKYLVPFEKDGFVDVSVKGAKHLKKIHCARLIKNVDKIIFVPKLKSHMITKYTGAIKNCYGCVGLSTRREGHTHSDYKILSECINDIYSYIKPDLFVMDAVVSMEGNGPTMGTPVNTNMIFISKDGVALDKICSNMIGINNLHIIKDAVGRGLGGENIEYVGDELSHFDFKKPNLLSKIFYFKLPFIHKMIYKHTKISPHIAGEISSELMKICPYKAITPKGINRKICKLCFRCYHHPHKVTKKKSLFARFAIKATKKSRDRDR